MTIKHGHARFSVCVLLYGDYPKLADRCLSTLGVALFNGKQYVEDVRIGLNVVGDATRKIAEQWADRMWDKQRLRTIFYIPDRQVGKYPLMRRMFYDESNPLAEIVMWFDDDTYFASYPPEWWPDIRAKLEGNHMVGQCRWAMPMQGNQWEWIKTQPWYNPAVGLPSRIHGRHAFRFCQGAWWVIRRAVLHDLNWPVPELHHNGGDSMLGEALRHQGLEMAPYDQGLRINADAKGEHSGAKRRGISEPVVGKHYKGEPLSTAHQEFSVRKIVYGLCRPIAHPDPVKVRDLPCW